MIKIFEKNDGKIHPVMSHSSILIGNSLSDTDSTGSPFDITYLELDDCFYFSD